MVHLAATAEQIDRQRERIRSNVFGGGHQQMSRSLADSREYDPDREPPEG